MNGIYILILCTLIALLSSMVSDSLLTFLQVTLVADGDELSTIEREDSPRIYIQCTPFIY